MKITNTLVLSTIVGEMLIPHHSAFIVSPAALGVTTPSVGTQQNIPSRRTGRGSKPLRMSTNPNNESREVTPKMEKYLKRMNEVLGAKRMSPEKKMYKIRILRSLADEGCYAVSVGDEDYGLDFLDQPIVDVSDVTRCTHCCIVLSYNWRYWIIHICTYERSNARPQFGTTQARLRTSHKNLSLAQKGTNTPSSTKEHKLAVQLIWSALLGSDQPSRHSYHFDVFQEIRPGSGTR